MMSSLSLLQRRGASLIVTDLLSFTQSSFLFQVLSSSSYPPPLTRTLFFLSLYIYFALTAGQSRENGRPIKKAWQAQGMYINFKSVRMKRVRTDYYSTRRLSTVGTRDPSISPSFCLHISSPMEIKAKHEKEDPSKRSLKLSPTHTAGRRSVCSVCLGALAN